MEAAKLQEAPSDETHPSLTWRNLLHQEREFEYFKKILSFIEVERKNGKVIYPENNQIFNAFVLTSLADTKVVIIGQDPYHGPGQAHGLSFSVRDNVAFPPSLQNIFKEIKDDLGISFPESGDLTRWAKQGVLLLNSVLSVEAGQPGSHAEIGWQRFTDEVIKILAEKKEGLVFLLWGSYAQKKCSMIDTRRHHLLCAAHPSPFSAHKGFLGCKCFSKTNQILRANGQVEVVW
jgi:uracil-DNA glycosylase